MPARTQIDPEATSTGLAASAQSRSTAISGTDITLPGGLYVGVLNALAAGLVAGRLADLATRAAVGEAAAKCSATAYGSTEQTNTAALTT